MIYFDNAATSRVSDRVVEAMLPYFTEEYGNPSSTNLMGQRANEALYRARESMAKVLEVKPEEIFFTSGGTEADNQIITSIMRSKRGFGFSRVISSQIEHHAVQSVLDGFKGYSSDVVYVGVGENGIVKLDEIEREIDKKTDLVSIMYANNEIGTIQPIKEIGELCKKRGVLFHTDAVQAAGHMELNIIENGIDYLSLSAHKFGGPKGVGALFCRKNTPLFPLIKGGAQEKKMRAGTENIPGIIGMAEALKESYEGLTIKNLRTKRLRDTLEEELLKIPGSHLNGDRDRRLCGTLSISFDGIVSENAIQMLNQREICVSSGSACTSGDLEPSHVLLAMGRSSELAQGTLRFTLNHNNTPEEVWEVCKAVREVVETLRN